MSEPFRPYEKLVDITILGKKFQVPAQLAAAVLSVHQSGNDPLRAFLLESGLPVLPGDVSIARR